MYEALVDEGEVARLLDLSASATRKLRYRSEGPPFVKVGRSIRYRPSDVSNFLAARTRGQAEGAAT